MWRSAVQVCQGLRGSSAPHPGRLCGTTFGGLAQLARAPALQAGGQRFESVILHLRGIRGICEVWIVISVLPSFSPSIIPHSVIDMLEQKRETSGKRNSSAPALSGAARGQIQGMRPASCDAGLAKARKGARRMPVAREGDEGRGKLRKAPGRRKRSLIRGFPNGATRQSDGLSSMRSVEANLGN